MAKIYTTEWTSAILQHPTSEAEAGTRWQAPHPDRSTAPQSAPFAMTEEFASAYRMHSLLPDTIAIRALEDDAHLTDVPMTEIVFGKASDVVERHALEDLFYSFGRAHPGALTLGNYPNWLRSIEVPYGGSIDLAAVDILEDRERGMPRYCAFRRMLQLSVPKSFSDLTSDPALAATLERVYEGDIEQVDTMVGMFAETPQGGSGFGDTALRTFVLMSSHRLKPEQFFDTNYTSDVYTQQGLDWIEDNTMKSVLTRHLPQLNTPLRSVKNAFLPWHASA
jgi:hypothetical protein